MQRAIGDNLPECRLVCGRDACPQFVIDEEVVFTVEGWAPYADAVPLRGEGEVFETTLRLWPPPM